MGAYKCRLNGWQLPGVPEGIYIPQYTHGPGMRFDSCTTSTARCVPYSRNFMRIPSYCCIAGRNLRPLARGEYTSILCDIRLKLSGSLFSAQQSHTTVRPVTPTPCGEEVPSVTLMLVWRFTNLI